MSHKAKEAQQTFCPNFDEYMEDIEQDMQSLVMDPTDKRLKIIIMASNDAMKQLLSLLDDSTDDDDFECYKIPQKMYNAFRNHVYSLLKKKCAKGVNFGRVRSKKNYAEIWGLFKGHWFHNAPKEMSRHLWMPLFINIANYFHQMATLYAATHSRDWTASHIETFLKLRFIKNVLEVKCQINSQSNPGGPVIQFAVWKIPSMQNVLNRYYDEAFSTQWASWLSRTTPNGTKMRINSVVKEFMKPFALERFHAFCVSNRIVSEAMSSVLEITEHRIEKMKLLRYLCKVDPYSTHASNLSLMETKERVEDSMDSEDMVITNEYKGCHQGVSKMHSETRSRPYPQHRERRKRSSLALKDMKCIRCRKCRYHCRCPLYDPMRQWWMQYGYHMPSQYMYPRPSTPSQSMVRNDTHLPSLNHDMDMNEGVLFSENVCNDPLPLNARNNFDDMNSELNIFPVPGSDAFGVFAPDIQTEKDDHHQE